MNSKAYLTMVSSAAFALVLTADTTYTGVSCSLVAFLGASLFFDGDGTQLGYFWPSTRITIG